MCQKEVHWQRYTHTVLLLVFVAFISNSNQQKLINTTPQQQPQPFRFAKSVNENRNNVVSISLPATNQLANSNAKDASVHKIVQPQAASTNQRSLATVTSHVKQSEVRSIEFSLRELQNLITDLMSMPSQTHNDAAIQKRSIDIGSLISDLLFDGKFFNRIQKFTERFALPTAALKSLVPTGARLFLFKGMCDLTI